MAEQPSRSGEPRLSTGGGPSQPRRRHRIRQARSHGRLDARHRRSRHRQRRRPARCRPRSAHCRGHGQGRRSDAVDARLVRVRARRRRHRTPHPDHSSHAAIPRRSGRRRPSQRPAAPRPADAQAPTCGVVTSVEADSRSRPGSDRHCASAAPFPRASSRPRRSPRRSPPSSTGSPRDRCPLWSPLTEPFIWGWLTLPILMLPWTSFTAIRDPRASPICSATPTAVTSHPGRRGSPTRCGCSASPPRRRYAYPGSNAIVDFLLDDAPVVIEFDGQGQVRPRRRRAGPLRASPLRAGGALAGEAPRGPPPGAGLRGRAGGLERAGLAPGAGGAAPARCGAVPSTDAPEP